MKNTSMVNKKRITREKIIYILAFLVMALAVVIATRFGVKEVERNKLHDLRDEILTELSDNKGLYDESRIVLSNTTKSEATALAKSLNAKLRTNSDGSFATLTLPEGVTVVDVCMDDTYLDSLPEFSFDYMARISDVEEDEYGSGDRMPSAPQYNVRDTSYTLQTYLDYLNLSTVWTKYRGNGIKIAIIDTGIDTDHPEFAGRISEYSYNATEDKIVKDNLTEDGEYDWSLIEDEVGHGTSVAGVIGASMNSGEIVGIAPQATLIVIKAECDPKTGNFLNSSDLVFGLYYAIEANASVVNMSFGTQAKDTDVHIFREPLLLARDSDVICVAAAGNDSTAALSAPACDPYCIGVGALQEDSFLLADYSNYGENTSVVAPGTAYTTTLEGGYETVSGTSIASPMVTAAIALYMQSEKYAEFLTVKELLEASSTDLGELGADWYYGYGAIDVSALVIEPRGTVTFDMMSDELDDITQTFIAAHPLQNIPTPDRLYAVFDGWYYDPYCTDEFVYYEDAFSADLTLYANWVNEEDGIPYIYVELPDGTVEIRAYTGHRKFITIPDTIDGKIVSSIGVGAFKGNQRLREVTLPRYLVRIRDSAFSDCSNLVSIHIPDTVTEIGSSAFNQNLRLSFVALGASSSLRTVGESAFSGCVKLRTFYIPAALTSLHGSAFLGDTAIQSFDVDDGNPVYTDIDGVLCDKAETTIICYPYGRTAEYKIPDSIKTVGTYAFRYSSIRRIDLGCIEKIEDSAFVRSMLLAVDMPKTLKEVGANAFESSWYIGTVVIRGIREVRASTFSDCSSLYSVSFESGVVSIGNGAFSECTSLNEIIIGNTVEELGASAFERSGLKRVRFTESSVLKSIGESAFFLTDLTEIDLPASLESIGANAFRYTPLSRVSFGEGSQLRSIGDYAFSTTPLRAVTLPERLEEIGSHAFSETALTEIFIPARVSSFGGGVFAFTAISAIEVSEDNPYYDDINGRVYSESGDRFVAYPTGNTDKSYVIQDGIKSVGASSFEGVLYLENVTIPEGNEEIEIAAFASKPYRHSVVNVVIGSGLKTIRFGAFFYAEMLVSVNLPEGLTMVEQEAFYGTKSIQKLVIPTTLTVLGESSFFGCGARSYELPDTLVEIGENAMAENKNLTSLDLPDSLERIRQYAFSGNYSMRTVNISESTNLVRIGFAAFANCGLSSFRVPANISSIAQGAFKGCKDLKSFVFTENSKLRSITAYMFDGCENLTSVVFETGSELTHIQAHAFEDMTKLSTLDFGDAKITVIDNFAFRFCESLTRFKLPDSLTEIGRYAFYGCSALAEVTLPEGLEFIGRFAFLGTGGVSLYFSAETLPETLQEDWDYGIKDYYLGVVDVLETDTLKYAVLSGGGIGLIKYNGSEAALDLTELDLPCDIVNIGGGAFAYSSLESIVLPESLVTIQAEAFMGSSVKSVRLPDSVRFIGRSAFEDAKIETVVISEHSELAVIEQYAFAGTVALERIYLPASVTTLGRAVFKNSGLTEVIFAEEIVLSEMPEESFAYTRLATVSLPKSVTLVDHNSFREIKTLESVDFGTGEMMIMSNAFYGSGLTSLHIPKNVTYIGEYSFVALKKLTEFTVDEDHPYYRSEAGLLLTKDGRKLIAAPAGMSGSFTLPLSIEVIGFGAFEETALSEVNFDPNANILSLGYRAFFGARNIKYIHIPASVVAIDYYAFANCTALERVTFAEGSGLRGIYEGAFLGCTSLNDISLPREVVEIAEFAFYACRSLDRVPISEDAVLKGIYDYAMAYTGLSGDFTLPETLIDVGTRAFMGTRITSVTIPDTNSWDLVIGLGAFEECNNIEEMTLPFIGASLDDTEISWFGYIFGAGADIANDVYVPENLKKLIFTEGMQVIGKNAFSRLSQLETVELPNSVNTLYPGAFAGTNFAYEFKKPIATVSGRVKLNYAATKAHFNGNVRGHITLADGVVEIGDYTFAYDYIFGEDKPYLTGVTLPETVRFIGDCAFYQANWSVKLPNAVCSIGKKAFYGCSCMEDFYIPSSLTEIGESAFDKCPNIKFIVAPDHPTLFIDSGILYNRELGVGVYDSPDAKGSITVPEGITKINFEVEGKITELHLPSTLSSFPTIAKTVEVTVARDNPYFEDIDGVIYNESITKILFINKSLKDGHLIIPDTVTDIGRSLEYGLFVFVTFPAGMTEMPSLYGCSKLQELVIPEGIVAIDDFNTFWHCTSLEKVTLPSTLVSLDTSAFAFCDVAEIVNNSSIALTLGSSDYSGLTQDAIMLTDKDGNVYYKDGITEYLHIDTEDGFSYVKENGVYYLVGYKGDKRSVTLPDNVFGESYTMRSLHGIKQLVIAEGAEKIKISDYAPSNTLETIVFPSTAKTVVSSYSTASIPSLRSVVLNDGLETIESYAFYQLGLTYIYVPATVSSIYGDSFRGCSISAIDLNNDNPYYKREGEAIYNSDMSEIVAISESVIKFEVPATVTTISKAFSGLQEITFADGSRLRTIQGWVFQNNSSLRVIELPDGLVSIGQGAFSGCVGLTSIRIPQSVTSIGGSAFSGCTGLTSVSLPENLTSIDKSVFSGCTGLTSVSLPGNLTSIGNTAFSGCTGLTSVSLPENLTSIGNSAFYGCTGLTSISMPNTVTSIGTSAFSRCTSLVSIALPSSITIIPDSCFSDCSELQKVIIPDNITTIGKSAFQNCASLKALAIPPSVSSIGAGAFAGSGLTSISLADNKNYTFEDGIIYDKEKTRIVCVLSAASDIVIANTITDISGAFKNDTAITSVRFEEGSRLTSIGAEAFYGCTGLTSVSLPENLTSIGKSAFSRCTGLTSVSLPENLTSIGNSAFSGCTGLTSVSLPENLTSIANSAFYGCTGLTSVSLPKNLTSIGNSAFYGCTALKNIVIPEGVISIGEQTFGKTSIYYLVLPSTLVSIDSRVFEMADKVRCIVNNSSIDILSINGLANSVECVVQKDGSVVYPNTPVGVTVIERDGFVFNVKNGVYTLIAYIGDEEIVTLPTDIDGNAYLIKNFFGPKTVIIPKSITEIPESAFRGSNIEHIVMHDGITSIGNYAFQSSNIREVFLGKSLINIGYEAFEGCTNLVRAEFDLRDIQHMDSIFGNVHSGSHGGIQEIIFREGSKVIIGRDGFSGLNNLRRVEIHGEVEVIGESAFYRCKNLESVIITGTSLRKIESRAFYECMSLSEIVLPRGVSYIGASILNKTAYEADLDNWRDGVLYLCDTYVIDIDENYTVISIDPAVKVVASDAFAGCYRLKTLTLGKIDLSVYDAGTNSLLKDLTNLETLILRDIPDDYVAKLFKISFRYSTLSDNKVSVPLTFKNLVLLKGVRFGANPPEGGYIAGFDGINVYIEEVEKNLRWDENYEGWRHNYKVTYGDRWVFAEFENEDGKSIATEIYSTAAVIRQPWVNDFVEGHYLYTFRGYDLDGDGAIDAIPATSANHIKGVAVYDKQCVNHVFDDGVVLVVPTHTSDGLQLVSCDCGYTTTAPIYRDEYLRLFGHVELHHAAKTPTCTETGWDTYVTCEVCDYTTFVQIPANGHIFGEWYETKAPTCTAIGTEQRNCKNCDYFETHDLAALGHDEANHDAKAPTCTEIGWKAYVTCSKCDYTTYVEIPATGHSMGEWVETKAPTCLTKGTERRDCHCGHFETHDVVALGHDIVHHDAQSVTCTVIGWNAYDTCSRCDYTTYVEIPAAGHMASEWIIDVEATYEANGSKHKECNVCHTVLETSTIPMLTHSYVAVVAPPTCAERGYTTYTCSDCGDVYIDDYVDATGHTYGEWSTTTAATCTTDGQERRDCENCDHFETRDVVALGHDTASHPAQSATCTDIGWNAYETCLRCDYTTYVEIPANGHSYGDWVETVAPTCAENGEKAKECSVCHNVVTEVVDKLGHDEVTHNAQTATCEQIGWNAYVTCSRCDYTTYVEIPKLDHSMSEWTETTAPTCLEKGEEHRACGNCEYSETRELAALNHDRIEHEAKAPSCTEVGWDAYVSCSRCDYTTYVELPSNGGHTFGEWERIIDPTPDTAGMDRRTCSVCANHENRDVAALGYLQAFINAVETLSENESVENTYSELYSALQLYSKLTDDEKQEANEEFLVLQTAINAYNSKAEMANTELKNATEIAFIPISASFTFLAALWFLLKKKFWIK